MADAAKQDVTLEAEANAEPDAKRRRTLLEPDSCTPLLVEWLQSAPAVVVVETSDGSRRDTFHVHIGALKQMPYFEAYADRWAKDQEPCKLQLPQDVELEDFKNLLVRIYAVCRCTSTGGFDRLHLETPLDLNRAVALYLLADMMLAEQLLPEARSAICMSVRTAENLKELHAWARRPGAKALAQVIIEIESEREDPFLANLVKSVVGDGNRVLGCSDVLELKSGILQDRLKERADLGLHALDVHVVIDALKAHAWIGIVYYDQAFKVSPQLFTVWRMIEPHITTDGAFAVARALANELDRPAGLNRVSYRGEQRYSLSFSGNRQVAVEVMQGIFRAGAKLAEQGVTTWTDVMSVLPQNYESAQFEVILQPVLQVSPFQVELLLPYLKRVSLDFLAKLLRTSPRTSAQKIARHIFKDEAALKPNKEVFEVIRELRLV